MAQSGFYRPCDRDTLASTLALRPREAAAALGLSLSTLERLTRAGEIVSVLVGRVRLYELKALEAFLASRRVAGQEVTT
jgi:excisionase family DNA binding protein